MFQISSGMEKSLWVRGGGIAIFRREILSRSAEKLREVPSFNDIEILGYRKNFIHNRGCHDFPSNFCCLSGKKCRWRALRCLRKLRVSKCLMHKKGISLSSVEIFCFTVPIKNGWETHLCFKVFWFRSFS